MHRVMVRTLRGLEAIARTEVLQLLGDLSVAIEHRTLRFELPWLDPRLLSLGTVDDAFLVLSEVDGVGRRRSALEGLARLGSGVDGPALVAELRRPVTAHTSFDVTASFIGRRNFTRFEVEDRVGAAIAAATGWAHQARGPLSPTAAATALSFRVHLLHGHATLAARIAQRPLHRRAYRVRSRPGALHPPLARALCVIADPAPGDLVIDPACGVGTIPIEAALLDSRTRAVGFDIEAGAIAAARANARQADADVRFAVANAARLPLADGSVDRVVLNPPWGRAVRAAGGLRRGALWAALGRVLADGGRLVALLPADGDLPRGPDVIANVRVSGAEAVIVAT
jgi:tRNA (guanine6-N2)-methyltransferase